MHDPASQNPYMYCRGNPLKYSDPSGYDADGNSNLLADATSQRQLETEFNEGKTRAKTSVPFMKGSDFKNAFCSYDPDTNILIKFEGPLDINNKSGTARMDVLQATAYGKDSNGVLTRITYQLMPTQTEVRFFLYFKQVTPDAIKLSGGFDAAKVLQDTSKAKVLEVKQ